MNVFELYASLDINAESYYDALSQARNAASDEGEAIQNTLRQSIGDVPAPDTVEYARGLGEAEKDSETFVDQVNSIFQKLGIVAALAAAGSAIVDFGNKAAEAITQTAEYGDSIDKMSQKIGISAEAYQEWDAVMQHSGTSISTLQGSMRTLVKQAEKGSEAFKQLGISEQEVAELSKEDLFGRVIEGLQGMEEGSERTALAQQLLGRGAMEYGALLNTSAEATQEMKDRVHELNGVMSNESIQASAAFQDQLQDMNTALDGLKRNITNEFLPSITTVMSGLTDIFSGDYDEGVNRISEGIDAIVDRFNELPSRMSEVGKNIIGALGEAIVQNTPDLLSVGADTIEFLLTSLIDNANNLVDGAFTIVETLAQGISDNLPVLVPSAVDAVISIGETLLDNIDTIIDVAGKLIEGLAKGLIEATPALVGRIPEIIGSIATGLYNGVTTLVETAQNMVTEIITVLADYERWEQVGAGWYNALIRGLNGDYDAEHAEAMSKFEGKTVEELNQMRVNLQRQADGIKTAHDEAVESIKKYGTLNPDDISDLFIRNQFKEWRKTHQSEGWDVYFATELNDFNNQISNINEAMGQASNGIYNTAVESGETIDAAGEVVTAHVNDYGKNAQMAYAAMFEGQGAAMDESLKQFADNLDHLFATHKITQEEYDRRMSEYLNNNADKTSELWWKYYDGIAKRAEGAQEQSTKNITKSQKTAVEEISKTATETTKDLSSVFDVMSSSVGIAFSGKIKNLVGVIGSTWESLSKAYKKAAEEHTKKIKSDADTYTKTLQGIWDGYIGQLDLWKKVDISDTLTAWQIGDIDRQTAGLQRYEDTYKAVLGRMGDEIDDTEKNLLKKISGMSLEDKTSFTDYLAGMTEAEFNAYMQSYKKYVEQAGELATIEGNSISDINEEIAKSLISDVDYEGIGKTGAEQYLSGFYEGIKDFVVDIGSIGVNAANITQTVPVKSTPAQTTPENITVNINGIQFKTVDELTQALVKAITNTTNRRKAGYAV
jgi:phage-related protein